MNKEYFKYRLLALLFVFCVSINATAQNVKVEAKLQSFAIKIGEQTKLFLTVDQPAKERVNFPALLDTITSKIQIVSVSKPDTTVDQKDPNRITVIQGYVITSFDNGTQNIPSLDFGTTAGVIKSNQQTLQVQTVKVDTTKAIYDIKQPFTVTYTFWDWLRDYWIWVAGGVTVIVLMFVIYHLLNRPKALPIFSLAKPALPIHTVAINKLTELRAKNLWQQDEAKQYHSELTDIIREYLEQRYTIKTYEKTTDEILASLNNREITGEYRQLLQQFLTLADLVKFAKVKPTPQENEESIENAIAFVLKTKVDETTKPDTRTEGGSVDEPV
jgi:hypothetical protein